MPHTVLHRLLRWVGVTVVAAALASPSLAQSLTVATDSSLGLAMKEVARAFEAGHAGVSITLRVGAVGALLDQIAHDGPADVLAGADADTLALGVQRRLLVADLPAVFASNTLVLVVPASSKLPVQRLSDLARPEVLRIAMAREASVPAGRQAREAINAQRLWPSVQRKVVVADDVREVLALVASADVEAGFVYATDAAQATGRVRVVDTPLSATPMRYLASAVADSRQPALAREFIAYLRSEPAHAVLQRFGFGVP